MMQWKKLSDILRAARAGVIVAALTTGFLTTSTAPADARGGHGFGRSFGGHGLHGRQTTGDPRHGNDAYMKAASDETEKLLKGKLNSICRGC